jgi:hypothetical protein
MSIYTEEAERRASDRVSRKTESIEEFVQEMSDPAIVAESFHPCSQCNRDMGHEWILGPVCGKCCRLNHRRAAGHGR